MSLDWIPVTSESGPFENDVSLIPLLFNARWGQPSGSGQTTYFGVGLGILFAENDPVLRTDDTNFGWQVFVGREFKPRIRGDLRFVASDHPGDDGVFLVQVGYRL
jgi:hypothetical protein